MPYFIIEKTPVFLSSARHRALEEEVGKDKSATWRVGSHIAGNKAAEEKSALMYQALLQKSGHDPDRFRAEWVHFDLRGEEAVANVWRVLYDYCHFRGYAFLSDLRDSVEKIVASYEGESFAYPMGRIFTLNHFVKPAKWWWKFTHRMAGRKVSVHINSHKVVHIVGDLAQFEIYGEGFVLLCGEHLDVRLF